MQTAYALFGCMCESFDEPEFNSGSLQRAYMHGQTGKIFLLCEYNLEFSPTFLTPKFGITWLKQQG